MTEQQAGGDAEIWQDWPSQLPLGDAESDALAIADEENGKLLRTVNLQAHHYVTWQQTVAEERTRWAAALDALAEIAGTALVQQDAYRRALLTHGNIQVSTVVGYEAGLAEGERQCAAFRAQVDGLAAALEEARQALAFYTRTDTNVAINAERRAAGALYQYHAGSTGDRTLGTEG